MPNLRPPVTTTAHGARLPRPHRRRASRGRALPAAPHDLPHGQHERRRRSPRQRRPGIVHAAKYYPAGATTNSDAGVTAIERAWPAFAAMQNARPRAVAARRGHRPRRRRVRSRARLRRSASHAHRARLPGPQDRAGARDDARGRGVRRRGAGKRRGDDHAAASSVVAQRALRRRVAAAFVLHADSEARSGSRGACPGGDVGQPEILPWHRFGATSAPREGERLLRRRMLLGAARASVVRGSLRERRRAGPARGHSQAISAPTSTDCRAMRTRSLSCAKTGRCRPSTLSAAIRSCRCVPEKRCAGASRRREPRRRRCYPRC